MTDGEDNRSCGACDTAKVMSETEDRPAVGYGAEISVLSVGQFPIVDELSADDGVLACLEGETRGLTIKALRNVA